MSAARRPTPPPRPQSRRGRGTGPPADHVAELKRQEGADIGLHGSLTLARSLLNADLVDELRLVVSPALAGAGRRLFDDTGALHLFELASVDRSGGCLLLHYRRRSAAG